MCETNTNLIQSCDCVGECVCVWCVSASEHSGFGEEQVISSQVGQDLGRSIIYGQVGQEVGGACPREVW